MMYINEKTKQMYKKVGEDRYIDQYSGHALKEESIMHELTFVGLQFDLVKAKKTLPRKRTYYILQNVEDESFLTAGKIDGKYADMILKDEYKNSILFYDFYLALSYRSELQKDYGKLRVRKLIYNAKEKSWSLSDWANDYK